MKTNDVTGRYTTGEVGIGLEFGRPCIGFRFRDVELVAKKMIQMGVELEPYNPLTALIDERGNIKYKEIRNEKAMSAILEMSVKQDKMIQVINAIKEVSKKIDTVITVDIITKCIDEETQIKPLLDEAGIKVRINGKANMALGRPLIP
jgi:hypothetical protein